MIEDSQNGLLSQPLLFQARPTWAVLYHTMSIPKRP
jgi:hypothetical protein